jgi:hypothetical protein
MWLRSGLRPDAAVLGSAHDTAVVSGPKKFWAAGLLAYEALGQQAGRIRAQDAEVRSSGSSEYEQRSQSVSNKRFRDRPKIPAIKAARMVIGDYPNRARLKGVYSERPWR